VAEGIDADPAVIAIACRSPEIQPNMIFTVADLNVAGGGRYDAVTAIAVVHHLPLAGALAHMRSLLAPGGKIVVVGCYRLTTRTDHLVGLAAVPANMIIGYLKAAHATEARVAMSARTAPAQTTLAEIRNVAARVLPGARIRRRLFWRYSLTFTDLSTIEPVLAPGKSRSAI
jgi:2-polyprenyl-3-methyl-5-hydroxy-6-metoxy-1,4-benzoquinol methylase